jgi:hypothetical protein
MLRAPKRGSGARKLAKRVSVLSTTRFPEAAGVSGPNVLWNESDWSRQAWHVYNSHHHSGMCLSQVEDSEGIAPIFLRFFSEELPRVGTQGVRGI